MIEYLKHNLILYSQLNNQFNTRNLFYKCNMCDTIVIFYLNKYYNVTYDDFSFINNSPFKLICNEQIIKKLLE